MIGDFPFEGTVSRVSMGFDMLLAAFMGRYQAMRASGRPATPSDIRALSGEVTQFVGDFLTSATREIDLYAQQESLDGSEALQVSIEERRVAVQLLVRGIALEAAQQLLRTARSGIANPADALSHGAGSIGELIQRRLGSIAFRATDTSGRQWSATKLMAVVVRDFCYQSFVESTVDRAGPLAAALRFQGPYIIEQTVFYTSEPVEGYPGFDEVRGALFHPNSNVTVSRYDAVPT